MIESKVFYSCTACCSIFYFNPDGSWHCPREFHPCSTRTALPIACGGSTLGLWL